MVKSPCCGKCRLDTNTCTGCGRTGDEIANWCNLTDAEQDEIINRLNRLTINDKTKKKSN